MCWVSHTINHCFLDGPGAPASFQQGGHRPTRRGGTFMGQVIGMKAFHRKNGWIYGGFMVDLCHCTRVRVHARTLKSVKAAKAAKPPWNAQAAKPQSPHLHSADFYNMLC